MALKMTLPEARDLVLVSQRKLDKLAGLRSGTTFQIEAGRNAKPSYETVMRLIRGLQRAGLIGLRHEQIFEISDDLSADEHAEVA
jgi:DNA-binding XRE family transcriptional regulator